MASIDRRGEVVAILGALLSLAGAVVLALLGIWAESSAVWAACFQVFGTIGIWLLALIHLHQQRLVAEERLEIAALEQQRQEKLGGVQTIFDEEDLDQMDRLAMGRRLRAIERFLIPTVALLIAGFHLIAGIMVFPWLWQFPPIKEIADEPILNPEVTLFFCGGMAFACFMFSRYALGMSRLKGWATLRAGGNFLFGTSAICLAIAVSLLCVISGLHWIEAWLARAIGVVLIILACEMVINFVLDFYRPRLPDQPQRPFYDSRFLGMFSEPGGILRSMANAVDYQFGFKVSETWFYKLLGRAVLPLLLVQIAVIFALTCFVVVPPGHQAVIEHFGRPQPATAKPGIHFTWFWPIDRATIIPVERISRMELGHEEHDKRGKEEPSSGVILWTKKHFDKEYQLLVADRSAAKTAKVPVNLLNVSMPVQWRVKPDDTDVIRYYCQSNDVKRLIKSIAYRELTRYAAHADVLDLLGTGGVTAAQELQERIQAACDRAGYDGKGLGIEIVHVGIGGVHPPPDDDVAKAYEDVVSALETRDATIKKALGTAAEVRVRSAGSQWETLHKAIVREDTAEGAELEACTADVERILSSVVGGTARELVANASWRTVARVFEEKSRAERYTMQLAAYGAAPHTYKLRLYLRMMSEALRGVRKYIVTLDDPTRVIYEVDMKPQEALDIMGAELAAEEARKQQ